MGNAIWLFTALPMWFFSSILSPLSAGALSLIPTVGAACLVIGMVLVVWYRAIALWVFVIPALISQVFVAIAGFFRGALISSSEEPILTEFFLVQLCLCLILVYQQRKLWLPATLFAIFNLAYAFFALFIATMALTDNWL